MRRSSILLTLAFFGLSGGAIALMASLLATPMDPDLLDGSMAVLAATAGILWFEGRQDLDAVLVLVGSVLSIATIAAIGYLYVAQSPGTLAKLTLAASLGGATVALAWTWRRQRSSSTAFPNVLAAQVSAATILEKSGIQYAGLLRPGGTGAPHTVSIFLQNCFDGPRKVLVRLETTAHRDFFRLQPEHEVPLAPAEVCEVSFPVVTRASASPGLRPLYVSIRVMGEGGHRVRLWRAREANDRVSAAMTMAMAIGGYAVFGGGTCFRIGPLPDDLWNIPLPAPSRTSIWQPGHGALSDGSRA